MWSRARAEARLGARASLPPLDRARARRGARRRGPRIGVGAAAAAAGGGAHGQTQRAARRQRRFGKRIRPGGDADTRRSTHARTTRREPPFPPPPALSLPPRRLLPERLRVLQEPRERVQRTRGAPVVRLDALEVRLERVRLGGHASRLLLQARDVVVQVALHALLRARVLQAAPLRRAARLRFERGVRLTRRRRAP